jgi:hypothetical protein
VNSPLTASRNPPASGPTVNPRLKLKVDSAFADGRSSERISRGTIACRAGLLTAKHAAWPATTT